MEQNINQFNQIPEKLEHNKVVANIKNVYTKTKMEILLNNWCVEKTNNEYIFYKHFNSDKKGVIHQLILSGGDYDGIYEFEVFGHDLSFENVYDQNSNDLVMKINSLSNYDLAEFNKKGYKFTVDKLNKTKDEFMADVTKYLSKLSRFDVVEVKKDSKVIELNQQQLGEVKFRKRIYEFLKDNIDGIKFIQKKKQYCISKIDLGEKDFKEEIINMGLVTEEEYNTYTSQRKDLCSKLYSEMKKVAIV